MPDYYNDVKNEDIIGEITNSVHFKVIHGRGGWSTTYIPVNILFTRNFLLSAIIQQTDKFQDNGGILFRMSDEDAKGLEDFLSRGEILGGDGKGLGEMPGNVNVKLSYDKINRAYLENAAPTADPFQRSASFDNYARLKLDRGIAVGLWELLDGGTGFLFSNALFDKAQALINGTPLQSKLVVQ